MRNVRRYIAIVLLFPSVHATTAENRFQIVDTETEPGVQLVGVPIVMSNLTAVQGYALAICHNDAEVSLQDVQPGDAAIDAGFDFAASAITPAIGATLVVILDVIAPFSGNTIPAGEGHPIARFFYSCDSSSAADVSSPLSFCDGLLGDPPIENVMVSDDTSIGVGEGLVLVDGSLLCTAPTEYIRGDSTDDGRVDIADPIRVVSTLFRGGAPFGCDDAADANGDGVVDTSDAVFLVTYLFLGGPLPPPPFPACGSSTVNAIGCAAYLSCP